MDSAIQAALRQLPAIDEVLREGEARGLGPRWALTQAAREAVAAARGGVLAGDTSAGAVDWSALEARIAALVAPSLRPVLNATGVVLHTNLGRAPAAPLALEQLARVAAGYSTLEYDLEAGKRGSRHGHLTELLKDLCGAEDAVVVNNNAAAVLLCLTAFARDREAIVSRGELVEIGGSFRIPDVMTASGATLREVGTTNRTHLRDYAGAIGEQTGMLLKVHQSNYAIVGFTAEVSMAELVSLGRERGVPTMFDLGSGSLVDLRRFGLPAEPTVGEVVSAGFDLVSFSGDKLLGGPQAGVICGRAEAVATVRSHPLMRAVRPDKLCLAALQATLSAYRDGVAEQALPALAMLAASDETLRARADRLAALIGEPFTAEVVEVASRVGGGAAPTGAPASWAVALRHPDRGANELESRLRAGDPPLIARIEDGRLLLDVRTLAEDQVELVAGLVSIASR